MLSDAELIPYIKGLVFLSKKEKKRHISFEDILDQNLNGLIFQNNEEFKKQIIRSSEWDEVSKIISKIKETIILRAKQLYPHLREKT